MHKKYDSGRDSNLILADGVTIPENTDGSADTGDYVIGPIYETEFGLGVRVVADSDIYLASDATDTEITLAVYDAPAETGTFSELIELYADSPEVPDATDEDRGVMEAGTVMARRALPPGHKPYLRASIASDSTDGAGTNVTGDVSIFLEMLR